MKESLNQGNVGRLGSQDGNRWLQNVSLRWKLGFAVMLALLVGLTFVWISFSSTIDDVGLKLKDSAISLAQERTSAELSVASELFRDLAADLHQTITGLVRSTTFGEILRRAPETVGPKSLKWIKW